MEKIHHQYTYCIENLLQNFLVIEGVKIDTKIKDFLMDDLNISTQFEIKINEDIDLQPYLCHYPNLFQIFP